MSEDCGWTLLFSILRTMNIAFRREIAVIFDVEADHLESYFKTVQITNRIAELSTFSRAGVREVSWNRIPGTSLALFPLNLV